MRGRAMKCPTTHRARRNGGPRQTREKPPSGAPVQPGLSNQHRVTATSSPIAECINDDRKRQAESRFGVTLCEAFRPCDRATDVAAGLSILRVTLKIGSMKMAAESIQVESAETSGKWLNR